LLGTLLNLHGNGAGNDPETGIQRQAERKWAEVERFLSLAPPSLPEVLKDGWVVDSGQLEVNEGNVWEAGASPSKAMRAGAMILPEVRMRANMAILCMYT
jgi:hypothetical protein